MEIIKKILSLIIDLRFAGIKIDLELLGNTLYLQHMRDFSDIIPCFNWDIITHRIDIGETIECNEIYEYLLAIKSYENKVLSSDLTTEKIKI